jgi:hypothetical protein
MRKLIQIDNTMQSDQPIAVCVFLEVGALDEHGAGERNWRQD